MLETHIIKFAQTLLNKRGYGAGTPDGVVGNKTITALGKETRLPVSWTTERKIVGFIQLSAQDRGIDSGKIDGFWGPTTQTAFELLVHQELYGSPMPLWRPEDMTTPVNPNNWPFDDVQDIERFFGPKASAANLVKVTSPYPLKIAWDLTKTVQSFQCHKLVKNSIEKVLTEVHSYYGINEIKRLRLDLWGGCFNDRSIRGGSRPSTHAWGIAIDFDPERNQLQWGRDRASFAKAEYDPWWGFWEKEGWVSLGRARNFDWMHVQAAKLRT
jgi:hypothetical protein